MTGMEITEVLGNLGDFIGAIAVFGTIVYLAIQVRLSREATQSNTAALRASASWDAENVLAEFNSQLAESEEVALLVSRIVQVGAKPEDFSEGELARSHLLMRALLRRYQALYLMVRNKGLDEWHWDHHRRVAANLVALPMWKPIIAADRRNGILTADFLDELALGASANQVIGGSVFEESERHSPESGRDE